MAFSFPTDGYYPKVGGKVVKSSLPHRLFLAQLRLVKSTYCRWVRWEAKVELEDHKGGSRLPWNKLRPEEEAAIMLWTRASPELSPQQLALRIVDTKGWYVSESTDYCVLRRGD